MIDYNKYHVVNVHYVIWKRIFLSEPQLNEIIEGAIFYPNSFDIEILTTNPKYYKLWECLKKDYSYPQVSLKEMGYDENIGCYVVDIHSPQIMSFIRNVNRMWAEQPYTKKRWIEKYG